MDDVLVLIGADIQTNDLMEQVEGDSVRSEVFGRVESVTRAEWFDGGREGMKPALVFITPRSTTVVSRRPSCTACATASIAPTGSGTPMRWSCIWRRRRG